MRAAIYARFSSDNQNPRSCEDQVAYVRPWIEAQGWNVVAIYQDHAMSGQDILGRQGWQSLLLDSEREPRPFDVVVCEDLDRWGREFFSHLDGAGRLHRAEISLADPSRGLLDLGSTAGRIILSIAAATSAEVSQKISEHVRRGLDQRIGRISKPGGPTPYGYRAREFMADRKDSRGRQVRERVIYEPDPETVPIVRRIFQMRAVDGLGWGGTDRLAGPVVRRDRERAPDPAQRRRMDAPCQAPRAGLPDHRGPGSHIEPQYHRRVPDLDGNKGVDGNRCAGRVYRSGSPKGIRHSSGRIGRAWELGTPPAFRLDPKANRGRANG